MFEHLANFPHVIVVGPHRSGTTFVAHAIGHDTGKIVLDEKMVDHAKVRRIPEVLSRYKEAVLQAPYALPWAPVLSDEDTAVVCCHRSHKDIENSVKRSKTSRGKIISVPGFSSQQAEALWNKIRDLVANPFDINYEDMQNHLLYVPSENRKNWHHKQVDQSGLRYAERHDFVRHKKT